MLKVIIKDPGHMIKIGKKEFRTPVSISVNGVKIDQIMTILRRQGINDFKIREVSDTQLKKKTKQKPIVVKDKDGETLKILQLLIDKFQKSRIKDSEKLENRLGNIENMIKELVSRPSTKFVGKELEVKEGIKKKPQFEEDDNLFVPNIQTEGMKIQETSSIFKTQKSDENADESSDLLSKLTKKKGNKIN